MTSVTILNEGDVRTVLDQIGAVEARIVTCMAEAGIPEPAAMVFRDEDGNARVVLKSAKRVFFDQLQNRHWWLLETSYANVPQVIVAAREKLESWDRRKR